ncbi:MAG: hypothetical protein LBH69_04505 [Methanomassiliicoccaceae archaeon]|jgi:hypothetical protein|nr:hypothetical protein [Methanomassiliicoccaceae archaeon]
MLRPKDIKNRLHQNGLVQNGLYAWGGPKSSVWMELLTAIFPTGDDGVISSFTLVDGILIITETVKDKILIDEAIRIEKNEVKEVKLKSGTFGDTILVIKFKDDKIFEYLIQQDVKQKKKMVDIFNSNCRGFEYF